MWNCLLLKLWQLIGVFETLSQPERAWSVSRIWPEVHQLTTLA